MGGCCGKWIKETELNAVVWEPVKRLIDLADGASQKARELADNKADEGIRMAKELAKLQKEKEKCEEERFANVDGFMAGRIGKKEYLEARAELARKAEALDEKIWKMGEKIRESAAAADDGVREALDVLKKYDGETELTREIVEALVEKVVIYDPEHVEVRWRFSDEVIGFIEG